MAIAAKGRAARAGPAASRGLYQPLDWVLVRAPLLPVEAYLCLRQDSLEEDTFPQGPPGPFRQDTQGAVSQDSQNTLRLDPQHRSQRDLRQEPRAGTGINEALRRLLAANPAIPAAVAVGSPSLFDALQRSGVGGEDGARRAAKLLRYLIRMSTRPTPYGLFAGAGIARWGPGTTLSIGPARPRTRTRPDMTWLLRLVFELEGRPEVRAELRYLANPRAVARAGRVFLPAPAPTADGAGGGPAVSVRATTVVTRALDLARTPIPHERLVAELAAMPGATRDKAENLVNELWRQTLLLTDLRPPLTEASPAQYVDNRLAEVPAAAAETGQLAEALAAMAAWDSLPWGEAASAYRRLARLAGGGENSAAAPPQVDMALPLDGRDISRAVASEAARAAELLLRLTPLPNGVPHLAAYRGAFEARYGPEREVPLLELLDPEFGLGPPPAHFHSGPSALEPRKAELRSQTLLDLALSALRERRLITDLDDDILSRLQTCTPAAPRAPCSIDLSLFVVAKSAADLDAGRYQIVIGPNLGATAAGRNLGRFADLLGGPALAGLDDIAQAELAHAPDGLWAELVYLPARFRSANVAVRAHPRRYEIALGTTPGVAADRVIPLEQLVVGIRDGRFYVRWPQHGGEVIGCAGHMLNNVGAPDACRFLDDLRRDGQAQLSSFDWGPAFNLPVLPRVQAGRIVLSLARWRLGGQVIQELAPDRARAFPARLSEWRGRWQVPRYVYLSFADNRLLLDLEDQAQAGELRAELHKLPEGGQVLLEEALPGPGDAWVPGPGGRFVTEVMVPLVLRPGGAAASGRRPAQVRSGSPRDRIRAPGSDWLFAKLYGPRTLEDDLLTWPVPELCERVLGTGMADDWFFIRYADPDPHLRLRFHGQPDRLIGELAPELCSWANALIGQGRCSRLCLDTYERELERYGGPQGMSLAESIFGADSRFVVEALRLSQSGVLGLDMTALAVLSIDNLLADLGLSEAERLAWYRTRLPSKNTSGEEYRRRQADLRALLGDPGHLRRQPGGDALARILALRGHDLTSHAQQQSELTDAGEISQPAGALIRSYVHLHCNRLLGPDGPAEDQVIGLLQRTRYGLSRAPLIPHSD
jgi:thiopeptide-type bacteriocin biosynthesis protein